MTEHKEHKDGMIEHAENRMIAKLARTLLVLENHEELYHAES